MLIDDGNVSIRNCKFAFKCDKKWEDLIETNEDEIRFCDSCEREVHFCADDEELAYSVRLNRCVAFVREHQSLMGDVIFPRPD